MSPTPRLRHMAAAAYAEGERYAALWDPVCCARCGASVVTARPVRTRDKIGWQCRCGTVFDLKDKVTT